MQAHSDIHHDRRAGQEPLAHLTYRCGGSAGFSPASLFGAGTARLLSMRLVAASTRKPGNPVGDVGSVSFSIDPGSLLVRVPDRSTS